MILWCKSASLIFSWTTSFLLPSPSFPWNLHLSFCVFLLLGFVSVCWSKRGEQFSRAALAAASCVTDHCRRRRRRGRRAAPYLLTTEHVLLYISFSIYIVYPLPVSSLCAFLYRYTYILMSISVRTHLSIYLSIYMYIYIYVAIYIYMYLKVNWYIYGSLKKRSERL